MKNSPELRDYFCRCLLRCADHREGLLSLRKQGLPDVLRAPAYDFFCRHGAHRFGDLLDGCVNEQRSERRQEAGESPLGLVSFEGLEPPEARL